MRLISRLRNALVRISPEARQVWQDRLTYLSTRKLAAIERELRRIRRQRVPGDVVEFGVALGGSGVLLAKAALADGRRFRGYDVFAMIPEPTSEKDDEKSRKRYETIRSGRSTGIGGDAYYGYMDNLLDRVTETFRRYGAPVDGDRVALVRGLFQDSWPTHPVDTVAFAHIDCDWYDPVRFCLDTVADRVPPRGVIVLDDYFDYSGCRTATDEFLARRPDYRRIVDQNMILRRTAG